MKFSRLFGRPSKEVGKDLSITSHRLLTQAGFIRESAAGRYYFMPLGQRVQQKIIALIKRHMDESDAQELLTPVLHPLELWQETNRTNSAGFELMQVKDRREAEFALGGTAEEMIIDLVRKFNISYKDLPFNIYQFSLKFRDELRARGGLLRVREFIMKDAYSFGTESQFKETYSQMAKAYQDIFTELGLQTDMVESDNGYIGGEYCHEFVVPSEIGESRYFTTEDGSYAAHEDVAKFAKYQADDDEEMRPIEEVEGKDIIGVEELAKFLNIPVEKTTKTILFETEAGEVVAAAVNGLYDINETKLKRILGCAELKLATPETVKSVTGAEVGYAGFLNLPKEVRIVLDESVKGRKNFEVGANRTNFHSINVNFGRDFPEPDKFYDIAMARPGDLTFDGKKKLIEKRGIEVGNIFQLGYHYTNLMNGAVYTDEQGKRQKYYMGCYGIGVGRTMAAIAEIHNDDNGIIWPAVVAPYHVHIISLMASDNDKVMEKSQELYDELSNQGIEVLWDDRIDARAGEKFADADLIGIPHRVVISPKTIEAGKFEYKKRTDKDSQLVSKSELFKKLEI